MSVSFPGGKRVFAHYGGHEIATDQPLEHALLHLVSTQRSRSAGTTRAGMLRRAGQGPGNVAGGAGAS